MDEGRRNFLKLSTGAMSSALLPSVPARQAAEVLESLVNPVQGSAMTKAASYWYRTHLDVFNDAFFWDETTPPVIKEIFTDEYARIPFIDARFKLQNLGYFMENPRQLDAAITERDEVDVSLLDLDAPTFRAERVCARA